MLNAKGYICSILIQLALGAFYAYHLYRIDGLTKQYYIDKKAHARLIQQQKQIHNRIQTEHNYRCILQCVEAWGMQPLTSECITPGVSSRERRSTISSKYATSRCDTSS